MKALQIPGMQVLRAENALEAYGMNHGNGWNVPRLSMARSFKDVPLWVFAPNFEVKRRKAVDQIVLNTMERHGGAEEVFSGMYKGRVFCLSRYTNPENLEKNPSAYLDSVIGLVIGGEKNSKHNLTRWFQTIMDSERSDFEESRDYMGGSEQHEQWRKYIEIVENKGPIITEQPVFYAILNQ